MAMFTAMTMRRPTAILMNTGTNTAMITTTIIHMGMSIRMFMKTQQPCMHNFTARPSRWSRTSWPKTSCWPNATGAGWPAGREILALNLVSSPGSGKTSLLERTIREIGADLAIGVIEGDQATLNDAARIRATGAPAIQVNTGTGCHLDADMLARALDQLKPPPGSVVMIENVGNLVCPALFDLGERAKVVILSVTEGEDKPVKYPHMFRAASVMLLNKIDLLPHLQFDVQRCIAYAREVNPGIRVLQVSAQSGEGMQAWYDWLKAQIPAPVAQAQT